MSFEVPGAPRPVTASLAGKMIWLYGEPKIGKTTFASELGRAVGRWHILLACNARDRRAIGRHAWRGWQWVGRVFLLRHRFLGSLGCIAGAITLPCFSP